jgi:aspartate carbamoyltransferase regulatory subunit
MLKRKIEINYRKASELKARCKYCAYRKWTAIHSCAPSEDVLRYDWRCDVIGLESSRRYAVEIGCVCDHFKKGETLEAGRR